MSLSNAGEEETALRRYRGKEESLRARRKEKTILKRIYSDDCANSRRKKSGLVLRKKRR